MRLDPRLRAPVVVAMTLAFVVRSCTMPIASRMPSADPSTKPASVADSVTPAW